MSHASLRRLPGWIDPESAFVALAADAEDMFWLDAGPGAADGWSWLGFGVRQAGATVGAVDASRHGDSAPGGPFRGGWVGWVDYESGAARAGAPRRDSAARPSWMRVSDFLAFDHARREVWARGDDTVAIATHAAPPDPPALSVSRGAAGRHTPPEYARLIERARSRIRDGDAYQLCLTTAFDVPGPHDPVGAYRRLRRATPSHHGGFVRIGGTTLASATPERFLSVDDGTVRTRPIKGTRRRSQNAAADAALAAELRADVKERAENVMIVDLMRNDLSRVGIPGTVSADRLLDVESYAAVHQLVSEVSAALRPGTTLDDLLVAAFPAGSMTGAPKLSAMTILHELERGPRGVYAGCFGWVGDDGAADLAMVIRSILFHDSGASVGAGGGITWRSDPAAEVAEVGLKARAPLAALGAAPPPGW